MTVKPQGQTTIAGFNPSLAGSLTASIDTIGTTLPGLQAQLAAAVQAAAQLTVNPPTLVGQLESAVQMVAAITAAIAVGGPGVSGQLVALGTLIADLTVAVGSLEAQLAIFVELTAGIGAFGVEAWTFEGRCDEFASQIAPFTDSGFAGGSAGTQSNVLVLGTTTPAVWATIKVVNGV